MGVQGFEPFEWALSESLGIGSGYEGACTAYRWSFSARAGSGCGCAAPSFSTGDRDFCSTLAIGPSERSRTSVRRVTTCTRHIHDEKHSVDYEHISRHSMHFVCKGKQLASQHLTRIITCVTEQHPDAYSVDASGIQCAYERMT